MILSCYKMLLFHLLGALQLFTLEDQPTALFMMDGTMVIGALQTIAKIGLRCPEDIALACFDDFPWASVMRPHLTVVEQPTYTIGQQSAQLLFERLQQREKYHKRYAYKPA